jgi:hypothetical protein
MFVQSAVRDLDRSSNDSRVSGDDSESSNSKNQKAKNPNNDQTADHFAQSQEKAFRIDQSDRFKYLPGGIDEFDQLGSPLLPDFSDHQVDSTQSQNLNRSSHRLHLKPSGEFKLKLQIQTVPLDDKTKACEQETQLQEKITEKDTRFDDEICDFRRQPARNDSGTEFTNRNPSVLGCPPSMVSYSPNIYQPYSGPLPPHFPAFDHRYLTAWHGDMNFSRPYPNNYYPQPPYPYRTPSLNNWLASPVREPMPFYPRPDYYAPPRPTCGPMPVYGPMPTYSPIYEARPPTPYPNFMTSQPPLHYQGSSWNTPQRN